MSQTLSEVQQLADELGFLGPAPPPLDDWPPPPLGSLAADPENPHLWVGNVRTWTSNEVRLRPVARGRAGSVGGVGPVARRQRIGWRAWSDGRVVAEGAGRPSSS